MTHETNIYCPECEGTGENAFSDKDICGQCHGTGEINALAEIKRLRLENLNRLSELNKANKRIRSMMGVQ